MNFGFHRETQLTLTSTPSSRFSVNSSPSLNFISVVLNVVSVLMVISSPSIEIVTVGFWTLARFLMTNPTSAIQHESPYGMDSMRLLTDRLQKLVKVLARFHLVTTYNRIGRHFPAIIEEDWLLRENGHSQCGHLVWRAGRDLDPWPNIRQDNNVYEPG